MDCQDCQLGLRAGNPATDPGPGPELDVLRHGAGSAGHESWGNPRNKRRIYGENCHLLVFAGYFYIGLCIL